MKRNTLIVIAGPTAIGKTGLAITLAQRWDTEIISADSRQIFRELAIGTAKPTPRELMAVPHHFVGTQSIHADYDAGQFGDDALACIHSLFQTHDRVIMAGGSGLYIRAVCEGFDDMPDVPAGTRDIINEQYEREGLAWLQREVSTKDPEYFAVVDRQNPRRLLRALELFQVTGKSMNELWLKNKLKHDFDIIKIGLAVSRDALNQRIDGRVDDMIKQGLVEEARTLLPYQHLNALQTVGYAELFGYFENKYSLDDAIDLIKQNTRNYAKRQMTWFRKDKDINWFAPDDVENIVSLIEGDRKEDK